MTSALNRTAPCRIELVGVAGAGKSTLARRLLARHPTWQRASDLHTKLPAHWTAIAGSLPGVVPIAADGLRRPPRLSWEEMKLLVYAQRWDRFLDSGNRRRAEATIVDQGVFFALARLAYGGAEAVLTARYHAWARRQVERWAGVLDGVVWLDAPDDVLLQRIDDRSQSHVLKGGHARAGDFLARYRREYQRLVDEISCAPRAPVVRHFDTSSRSTDELVDEVETLIGTLRGEAVVPS